MGPRFLTDHTPTGVDAAQAISASQVPIESSIDQPISQYASPVEWDHPQYLQKDSLSHYLLQMDKQKMAAPGFECEEKQPPEEKIQAYFNEQFAENGMNLLTHYQDLREQLFSFGESIWVDNGEFVKQYFYPDVQSSEKIKSLCQNLWIRIQEVQADYNAILNYTNQAQYTALTVKKLPVSLLLEKYPKLYQFFEEAHFLEVLWSNMTFLWAIAKSFQDILKIHTQDVEDRRDSFNQAVIKMFQQQRLSRNISIVVFIFLRNVKRYYFSRELLIENPLLFEHLIQLPVDDLISVAKSSLLESEFLSKVLEKDEVNQRLDSHHYVQLTFSLNNNTIQPSSAAVILSMPQVTAKLTENDLFCLVKSLDGETLSSLVVANNKLMEEINGYIWFELACQSIALAEFIVKNKAIYDLFSPAQLKHLLKKKYEYCLLLDDDVYRKVSNIFTAADIVNMQKTSSWVCNSIKKLSGAEKKEEYNESTIFFSKEKKITTILYHETTEATTHVRTEEEIVTAFWIEVGKKITRELTAEESEGFLKAWGKRKILVKSNNEDLFNQLIRLCHYTSGITQKLNQLKVTLEHESRPPLITDSLADVPEKRRGLILSSPPLTSLLPKKWPPAIPANISEALIEQNQLPIEPLTILFESIEEKPLGSNMAAPSLVLQENQLPIEPLTILFESIEEKPLGSNVVAPPLALQENQLPMEPLTILSKQSDEKSLAVEVPATVLSNWSEENRLPVISPSALSLFAETKSFEPTVATTLLPPSPKKMPVKTVAPPIATIQEKPVLSKLDTIQSQLVAEKPLEAKPVPPISSGTKLAKYMEAVLMLASTLIITGATLGVSALFLPYLLTAAIAVLGTALLAFAAYGVMSCSQRGFFSSSNKSTHYPIQSEEKGNCLLTIPSNNSPINQ